jgi:hypothetical protein
MKLLNDEKIIIILSWPIIIFVFCFICFYINYIGHTQDMNAIVQNRPNIIQQKFEQDSWLVAHDEDLIYRIRAEK